MEKKIVGLGIALLVASVFLPTAIDSFSATDTSGWDANVAAFWPIIPLLALAGIALYFWRNR